MPGDSSATGDAKKSSPAAPTPARQSTAPDRLAVGSARQAIVAYVIGAVADAVLAAAGEAIGVMPRALVEKKIAHERVVGSMHEPKALMSDLGGWC
jgi:hypothetical protein